MPPIHGKPTFEPTQMIFVANAIGDPAAEHCPKEAQTTPVAHEIIFMKFALLRATTSPTWAPTAQCSINAALETGTINQSTSVANMVIPSKEMASAASIVSPDIVCWNATGRAFQDPCHIRSSICQIDNLTPSSKSFVRKYASTRAFQIPIKLRAVQAHALIDTGAQ
uniref:Peptidase A2 domain-containing protein n=1 Tax=Romanomermis culicivorax TaxID=13658 RepID=A0A915JHG8_ROMCU